MTMPGSWRSPTIFVELRAHDVRAADQLPQDPLMHNEPDHRAVGAAEDHRLTLQAIAHPSVDRLLAISRLACPDDRSRVVLGLEQARNRPHLPFVDADGGGLVIRDRSEVGRPGLARHEALQGHECAR